MHVTPSRTRSAIRTGGSGPACAHACRRALFTAAVTFRRAAVPAGRGLLQRPPRGRDRRDRAEQLPLVAHHPEIADHPGPVRDRARQVREDPAPVMPGPRRRQRRRQPGRQPGPVGQLPQQHQPCVRHDARAAACDVKTTGPSGSVHVEGAPRTRRVRTSAILILPVQEHFLIQAHRSAAPPA